MKHGVAVGAHWAEIIDGVDLVLLTYLRQGLQMMNVNEAFSQRAVPTLEVKAADDARDTPMSDALTA
ncbi:MAG: hypothetical protein N2544_13460, partial [Burkholderiales bacterium]|nr:hypothetical protein [Burkholderiales bacterium]